MRHMTGKKSIRAGFVQMKPLFGRKERNVEKLEKLLKRAGRKEVELAVAPELFNTGYVFRKKSEVARLAEKIPDGETTRALERISGESGAFIVAGLCEAATDDDDDDDGNKHYNSAVLVSPKKGFVSLYRKAHLFNEEKLWFSPGNTEFGVHDIGKAKIGMMICFDWLFPEVARVLALKGADVICQPANLVLPYCQRAVLCTAVQNRAFIITANRTGTERGVKFTGGSQIAGPKMQVLARGGAQGEEVGFADLDLRRARDKMVTKYNDAFSDRRPELYGRITVRPKNV